MKKLFVSFLVVTLFSLPTSVVLAQFPEVRVALSPDTPQGEIQPGEWRELMKFTLSVESIPVLPSALPPGVSPDFVGPIKITMMIQGMSEDYCNMLRLFADQERQVSPSYVIATGKPETETYLVTVTFDLHHYQNLWEYKLTLPENTSKVFTMGGTIPDNKGVEKSLKIWIREIQMTYGWSPSKSSPGFSLPLFMAREDNLPLEVTLQFPAVRSHQPVFWIENQVLQQGSTVPVMVNGSNTSGGIIAFEAGLNFEGMPAPEIVNVLPGWHIVGSEPWPEDKPKYFRLAGVGFPPVTKECSLFELLLRYPGKVYITLTDSEITTGSLEEEKIPVISEGGWVKIVSYMSVSSPDVEKVYTDDSGFSTRTRVYQGDSITLIVDGGVPPYTWKVESEVPLPANICQQEGTQGEKFVLNATYSHWMKGDPYLKLGVYGHSLSITITVTDTQEQHLRVYLSLVPHYGDVDGSGKIDLGDVISILEILAGGYAFTTSQEYAADVDGNGSVSLRDAAYILQYVIGKIDSFPVEEQVSAAPSRKQQFSFTEALAQLKEGEKITDEEAKELEALWLDVLQKEQAKWTKRLITTWGNIKNNP